MMDYVYTNGAIAVKEQRLLGERIFRMSETTAEDAFRTLTESGFGAGAEMSSVHEFEKAVEADARDIDAFIREYAPDEASRAYFLAPRDFHNAKAIVKANAIKADARAMLAPDGLLPAARIDALVREERYEELGKELGGAAKRAAELLKENKDGAEVGILFERALSDYLAATCRKNPILKKLLSGKADMTNLLTAFRAEKEEDAEKSYLGGGTLSSKTLAKIFRDGEGAERYFAGTAYADFFALCLAAKREKKPFTEAERALASYEAEFFAKRKYDLDKNLPFLYYVFRRRAENENVRILFVCLLAGVKEGEIKARLRRA